MGSRGGGRGRGRFGGGGYRYAKQESFVLFPDIQLPAIDKDKIKKSTELVKLRNKLQLEIKDLPYFIEETFADEEETVDIERYSDKTKKRSATNRVSLENSGYMTLQPGYFPLELVRGTKRRIGRKVQWNPKRDLKKLDMLEVLEDKHKDEDFKGKKGKDGEDEEEDEDAEAELEEDEYDSDDYTKNFDFDDDDDDYNQEEEHDDEGLL